MKKKKGFIYLAAVIVLLLFQSVAFAATEIIILPGGDGYQEAGSSWANSGLRGYDNSTSKWAGRSSGGPGEVYAQWTPTIAEAGHYEISVYKIVHPGSDPNAKLDVQHKNGLDTQIINFQDGESGWVVLGTYELEAGASAYVRNTFNSYEDPNLEVYTRASAARFVKVDAPAEAAGPAPAPAEPAPSTPAPSTPAPPSATNPATGDAGVVLYALLAALSGALLAAAFRYRRGTEN